MFRILYALQPNETIESATLASTSFAGLAGSDDVSSEVKCVVRMCESLTSAINQLHHGAEYAAFKPTGDWMDIVRQIDAQLVNVPGILVIEPWPLRKTVRELWLMAESIRSRNVRFGFSDAWGKTNNQPADRVVPTLNHRLGVISVSDQPAALEYTRRLAGIGFAGVLLIDLPASDDRFEKSKQIAADVKAILDGPIKPKPIVRKPVAPKAAAATE